MNTKLYRSNSDRMIGGVCGGLARYLNIDSTLVRLFFVLVGLGGEGFGVLLYFILWLVMPAEDQVPGGNVGDSIRASTQEMTGRAQELAQDVRRATMTPHPQAHLIIGVALIIVGSFWLLDNLNFAWLHWLSFDILGALLLIAGGIVMLVRRTQGDQDE